MKWYEVVLIFIAIMVACAIGCSNPNNSNNEVLRPDEAKFSDYNCSVDELKIVESQTNLCYKYTSKTGRRCLKEALENTCKRVN